MLKGDMYASVGTTLVCVCGLCGPRADLLASDVLCVIGWRGHDASEDY